jgi:hypothetical protein
MNDESQLTPPEYSGGPVPDPAAARANPAQRSWWSRWNRWLIGGAAAAVLVGGIGAAALVLVLKPASTIDRMAPASVDVYGIAYLDPSASQKVNLLRVLHRFPDTSTDQKLNDVLDKALNNSGLSYSKDVQPWLSGQLGLLVELPSGSGDPPTAVLITSRDDAKARTTLAKMRSGSEVKNYQWQDKTYDGVTISIGTPPSTTTAPGTKTSKVAMTAAYALVDHVAVLANSEDLIHQVIDTGRGRGTRLTDSSDFKATMAKLPSDRLGMVYVNGQSIVGKLKAQVGKLATSAATPLWLEGLNVKSLGDADAFRGIGLVLSARQDGVVLDVAMNIDSAKLSNKTNAAMLHPGHPDGVLTWIPRTADGFFVAANLNQTIQAVLDQAGSNASVRQTTDEIGLTGTNGVLGHLTGDYGVEASVDGTFTPTGAVLLGTDNAASMNRFLAGLMALALEAQGARPATSTSSYRGITITSLNMPSISLQGRFVPSYAVVDGMGIVASRPAELRAIIDAHRTHDTISADATYTAASKASLTHPSGVFYLNLGRVSKLLDSAAGSSLGKVDSKTKANLAPLKALMVTGDARSDGLVERFVLLIQ